MSEPDGGTAFRTANIGGLMRRICFVFTIAMLLASAPVFAGEAQSAKEGFKEVHEGMKKVTKSVDKKAKKDLKKIDKQAKHDLKKVDREAKRGWKEVGHDIKKIFND
jgi:esterase/lipase